MSESESELVRMHYESASQSESDWVRVSQTVSVRMMQSLAELVRVSQSDKERETE